MATISKRGRENQRENSAAAVVLAWRQPAPPARRRADDPIEVVVWANGPLAAAAAAAPNLQSEVVLQQGHEDPGDCVRECLLTQDTRRRLPHFLSPGLDEIDRDCLLPIRVQCVP